MTSRVVHIAWVGLFGSVQWAAHNGWFPNGRRAVTWVAQRCDAHIFDRREAKSIRPELGKGDRLVLVPAAQLIAPIKDGFGRLVFEPIKGGTPGPHGEWCISPARYAKGKCTISTSGWQGYKSRACRLAGALGGKYVGRSKGYTIGPKSAERFARLYEAGWDGSLWGDLEPPKVREAALCQI